ncbi:Hypothetical protein D9617_18g033560 [Elsinoe fawcettii]|nr:Hypothetical protein D9617_18g033560 [Elsinoe fawcettii]
MSGPLSGGYAALKTILGAGSSAESHIDKHGTSTDRRLAVGHERQMADNTRTVSGKDHATKAAMSASRSAPQTSQQASTKHANSSPAETRSKSPTNDRDWTERVSELDLPKLRNVQTELALVSQREVYYKGRCEELAHLVHELRESLSEHVERRATSRVEFQALHDAHDQLEAKFGSLCKDYAQMQQSHHSVSQQLEASTAQVLLLKQELVSNAIMSDFATDEVVGREFDDLFLDMQAWAIAALRGITADVLDKGFPQLRWLQDFMPYFDKPSKYVGCKKKYLMYTVIGLIQAPIRKMHEDQLTFRLCESDKSVLAGCLSQERPDVVDYANWKVWLATTKQVILAQDPNFLHQCEKAAVKVCVQDTIDSLQDIEQIKLSPGMIKGLEKIFGRAFQLLATPQFHPASYSLRMPQAFDWTQDRLLPHEPDTEIDLIHGNAVVGKDTYLVGCVYPAPVKDRNERGDDIDPTDIVKAKVLTNFIANCCT